MPRGRYGKHNKKNKKRQPPVNAASQEPERTPPLEATVRGDAAVCADAALRGDATLREEATLLGAAALSADAVALPAHGIEDWSPLDESAPDGAGAGGTRECAAAAGTVGMAAWTAAASSCDAGFEPDCLIEDYRLDAASGRGVGVVGAEGRDEGGEQYGLQEAALGAVLARHAERPVVLVSVAGAYRGGKSFLLDFFLRYLYAEDSARTDGSWLGAADAPLRGFSWRGGSARDTAGLLLWSQPFLATLPSGEQVVVLLMDTQGAFDEHSSLRDSSQIFALSTLLASVQVYNLSQKINESDLQHLQVFTEYAACGGGSGSLPALQLLVRDWSAPYEFPYGAAGGDAYLRRKLQEREEQPRELREVRRRLAASFADVACFLLPHPGLKAASDPSFTGCLADLTEEFKRSLLELVPRLLAPENLRVKTVEGRPLLARDLAPYLRAYLHAFRGQVPAPQTILNATAAARWAAAAGTARALVAAAAARGARGRAGLAARLAAARDAALAPLAPVAARAGEQEGLAGLEKELDERVARYVEINDGEIALAVATAKDCWERAVGELRAPSLCVAPCALERAVAGARAAAAARYDALLVDADESDPDRAQLIAELEARETELLLAARATNERNNSAAQSAALAALRGALGDAVPPRPRAAAELARAHAAARDAARAALRAARTGPAGTEPDPYEADLEKRIEDILNRHEYENENMNKRAIAEMRQYYNKEMELGDLCRHPRELAARHAATALDTLLSFCHERGETHYRRGAANSGLQMAVGAILAARSASGDSTGGEAAGRALGALLPAALERVGRTPGLPGSGVRPTRGRGPGSGADAARDEALRVCARPDDDGADTFLRYLATWIHERYDELVVMNERHNGIAVERGYRAFCAAMDACSILRQSAPDLAAALDQATTRALLEIKKRRLSFSYFGIDDIYVDQLKQQMCGQHEQYRTKNNAKPTGAEVAAAAGRVALAVGSVVGFGALRLLR